VALADNTGGIVPVGFANRDEPQLHFEALTYAELRAKMRSFLLTRLSRPLFHQLICVTGGEAATSVDFTEYHLGPGAILPVRPDRCSVFRSVRTGGWPRWTPWCCCSPPTSPTRLMRCSTRPTAPC